MHSRLKCQRNNNSILKDRQTKQLQESDCPAFTGCVHLIMEAWFKGCQYITGRWARQSNYCYCSDKRMLANNRTGSAVSNQTECCSLVVVCSKAWLKTRQTVGLQASVNTEDIEADLNAFIKKYFHLFPCFYWLNVLEGNLNWRLTLTNTLICF